MAGFVPLHTGFTGSQSLRLLVVITLAAAGTAALLGLAIGAFIQRQSRPYLLVVGAFTALFGRSIVPGFTMMGWFSSAEHHLLEHGLDVLLIALVIAAVYHSRTVSREGELSP
jgi:hypothetical protein